MKAAYPKTYFEASEKELANKSALKPLPQEAKSWYAENVRSRLQEAISNHAHFAPKPEGMKILEIGCGKGSFMRHCGKKNIIGLDLWEYGVRALKEEGFDARLHDAAEGLPFEDGEFDMVYSDNVIEHIQDGASLARETHRVLKDGGIMVIRTPDIARYGVGNFYMDYTHVHPYTRTSLARLATDHGFDILELENGRTTSSFIISRLNTVAMLAPKALQDLYFDTVCRAFSFELYIIARKKAGCGHA